MIHDSAYLLYEGVKEVLQAKIVGSESCSLYHIGSHMAGPIWLKLAGLVQGSSVTDMV